MTLDGTYRAVLDRIEDDFAVLEVSDDDERHELVVDIESLPADGHHADAVFEVDVADGDLQAATYDDHESETRADEAQDRFDRLTSQPQNEDEDEDEDGE